MPSKLRPEILTFKRFVLRNQVLHLYRSILREIKNIGDPKLQVELRRYAREEFERNKKLGSSLKKIRAEGEVESDRGKEENGDVHRGSWDGDSCENGLGQREDMRGRRELEKLEEDGIRWLLREGERELEMIKRYVFRE